MHTFYAFCGYYRCFIDKFSDRADPLVKYTTKKYKRLQVDWEEEGVREAFEDLKKAMAEDVPLAYPDISEGAGEYLVRTDANNVCIAAILYQYDREGIVRPIEFLSKKLTETERGWHITEKEGLAVVWAMKKWRGYLEGNRFAVQTDHNALKAITGKKDPHGRLERWMTLVQEFDVRIEHRPGKSMIDADSLTRTTISPTKPTETETEELEYRDEVTDCGAAPAMSKKTFAQIVEEASNKVNTLSNLLIHPPQRNTEMSTVYQVCGILDEREDTSRIATVYNITLRLSRKERKEKARRAMNEKQVEREEEIGEHREVRKEELILEQKNDEGLVGKVYKYLSDERDNLLTEDSYKDLEIRLWISSCELINNILTIARDPFGRHGNRRKRTLIFIPDRLKRRILWEAHKPYGKAHPQVQSLYSRLSEVYYWRGMYKDCAIFVNNCEACQQRKPYGPRREGKLQAISSDYPNQLIGMDLLEMAKSKGGYRYVLVIVCYFTKYCITVPLMTKTKEEVSIAFYTNWILKFGSPEQLISDQGGEFVNSLFKLITLTTQIEHRVTTPHHPQANGQVESTNKLLINVLKFLVNSAGDNWDVALPIAEQVVNTRTHPATLETPFFLWHLREYRLPSQVRFKCPVNEYVDTNQYVSDNLDKIEELYESVRFSILEDKEKREKYYNSRYGRLELNFEVGDKVWLYTPKIREVESEGTLVREKVKLAKVWEGPFRIVKLVGKGPPYSNYYIEFVTGVRMRQVVNVNRLKPYYGEDSEPGEGATEPRLEGDRFDFDTENFVENRGRYWQKQGYNERPIENENWSEEEWAVERILGVRKTRRNGFEFRIKWRGYGDRNNSWEPLSNIEQEGDAMEDFKRELRLAGKAVEW